MSSILNSLTIPFSSYNNVATSEHHRDSTNTASATTLPLTSTNPGSVKLDALTQLMVHHPNYLEPFLKTHNFILKGDGPLSYACRHYIAIMAAARHKCNYLVNLEREEFLFYGGDKNWLKGLQFIPKKLRDLNEINKILAHQPWLLTKGHIERLTKGTNSWSLSELVHAIVILTHFHALSSFVFSCNILPGLASHVGAGHNGDDENEKENGHRSGTGNTGDSSSPKQSPLSSSPAGSDTNVEVLMKKMQTISEQQKLLANSEDGSLNQEELAKVFNKVEQLNAQLSVPNGNSSPRIHSDTTDNTNNTSIDNDISMFIDDENFVYQDFARRNQENDITTFRIQDYSWDDHGYSLVNQLYNDVGNLLDDKFKICYNLTYYTMGRRANVDTSMFRRAIWNYIQCMYGIRHDDYDYREVNELLERNLKTYIKTLCCFPHRASKCNFADIMNGFRRSEKIHVNLMIFEARLQAELLYALRAVMRFMT